MQGGPYRPDAIHQTYKKNKVFSLKSLTQAATSLDLEKCKIISITKFQLLRDHPASLSEIRTTVKEACALCTMFTGLSTFEGLHDYNFSVILYQNSVTNIHKAQLCWVQGIEKAPWQLSPATNAYCAQSSESCDLTHKCHINQLDVESAWPYG